MNFVWSRHIRPSIPMSLFLSMKAQARPYKRDVATNRNTLLCLYSVTDGSLIGRTIGIPSVFLTQSENRLRSLTKDLEMLAENDAISTKPEGALRFSFTPADLDRFLHPRTRSVSCDSAESHSNSINSRTSI